MYFQALKLSVEHNVIIIITFLSQAHLGEHRGSTNWETEKSNQLNTNEMKCCFWWEEKTSPRNLENQQTQPTHDIWSGNQSGPH